MKTDAAYVCFKDFRLLFFSRKFRRGTPQGSVKNGFPQNGVLMVSFCAILSSNSVLQARSLISIT